MTSERDSNDEMRATDIDEWTAERLLSGALGPEDAPSGYAGLAALLHNAAHGPVGHDELEGEAAVVPAAAATVMSTVELLPSPATRRSSMIHPRLSKKMAAAATVAAFLGAGTAAAAFTGTLPTQATTNASPHADNGLSTAQSHLSAHDSASSSAGSDSPSTRGKGPVNGMKHGNATFGLCTAFNSIYTSDPTNPALTHSRAFQALMSQNSLTGAAATESFCTAYIAANPHGTSGSDESSSGKSTNKPSNAGPPSSTAPPGSEEPAAGGAGGSSNAPVPTPNTGGTGTANTASGGSSSSGTGTAGTSSGGASNAGSANAGAH
jgi:hypothetical protein